MPQRFLVKLMIALTMIALSPALVQITVATTAPQGALSARVIRQVRHRRDRLGGRLRV
jgi:hypothetical protein